MSRRRWFAALGVASIAVGMVSAAGAYAARPSATASPLPASARGAVLGHIQATPARHVIARNVPQTTAGLRMHSAPALGRNGKPAGSGLPSKPSTGSKPLPAHLKATPVGPKIVENGFNGIDLGTADCGCQPPDSNATIGPNAILETVNLEFAVYDKSGNLQFRTSLNNFLGTSDSLSDPRAVYDPTWNRWEFSLLDENTPSLWLVYSASSDPLGGWWFYHVGLPFSAGSITDYPQVGMNDTNFFYTTNNFDANGNYINSTAFTVPKARVYNGFGWGAGLGGVNYNTTPAIVAGHPTQQTDRTYMLSPDDANNLMYVYYWTDTAESPKLVFRGSISYNWAAPPRRVNQPGTSQTLDPLDGRIDWSVSQLDNVLWFAHGVAIGSFPGVNYGYVKPASMTMATQTAFHSATSDDFNPAISAEVNTATGAVQEVLTWAYTDTPNNVATTDVYGLHIGYSINHQSGAGYSGVGSSTGEFRFGDYASVWPEYNSVGSCPEGSTALVTNEYFAPDGTWRTRLARVHPSC